MKILEKITENIKYWNRLDKAYTDFNSYCKDYGSIKNIMYYWILIVYYTLKFETGVSFKL